MPGADTSRRERGHVGAHPPQRRAMLGAGLGLLVGCASDYKVTPSVEDTGIVEPDVDDCDYDEDDCIQLDATWELLPATEGRCDVYGRVIGGASFDSTLTGFRVVAEHAPFPGGYPLRVAFDEDEAHATGSYPFDTTYESEPVLAEEVSPTCWEARTTSSADLGTLADCGASDPGGVCTVEWFVLEIADELRAAEDGACADYVAPGTSIYLCLEGRSPLEVWPRRPEPQRTPPDPLCEPGGGEVAFVPVSSVNLDGDEEATTLYRPVQVSGTGKLTSAARIRHVQLRERLPGQFSATRGFRARTGVGFDDRLIRERGQVVALGGPRQSFVDADVEASTWFVLEEAPMGSALLVRARMEWECPVASGGARVDLPRRMEPVQYAVSLADLGCLGGWVQQLVARPGTWGSADYVDLQLRGFDDLSVRLPLHGPAGAQRFSGSQRGLSVAGTWLSASPEQGAWVRIDHIRYGAIDLCPAGTRFLPVTR